MPLIRVQEADFCIDDHYQVLRKMAPGAGAIVCFTGLVRELYDGDSSDKVTHIELSCYPRMTESTLAQIVAQAIDRFALLDVHVVHRIGKLRAAEQIVLVAVASLHRQAAFQGAQFIMDYLKTRATLWKKEVGERGTNWLTMKTSDQAAGQKWQ